MVQHVLLIAVAAPLIVLARPWIRLWRSLPLSARRPLARGLSQGERTAPLRALSRSLGTPGAQLHRVLRRRCSLARAGAVRHDARSAALHALEHTLFLAHRVCSGSR